MDSSRGFGSNNRHFVARFRLGFPSAPQLYRWLTSRDAPRRHHTRRSITRRIILQKARHQSLLALRKSDL